MISSLQNIQFRGLALLSSQTGIDCLRVTGHVGDYLAALRSVQTAATSATHNQWRRPLRNVFCKQTRLDGGPASAFFQEGPPGRFLLVLDEIGIASGERVVPHVNSVMAVDDAATSDANRSPASNTGTGVSMHRQSRRSPAARKYIMKITISSPVPNTGKVTGRMLPRGKQSSNLSIPANLRQKQKEEKWRWEFWQSRHKYLVELHPQFREIMRKTDTA